jgi:hypothetical protein
MLLKSLKVDLPCNLMIPLLVIHSKDVHQDTIESPAHPCWLQQPSFGDRCPTTDEWIKKMDIYSQWSFIQP